MRYDERKIQDIVEKVLQQVSADPAVKAVVSARSGATSSRSSGPTIHVPRASASGKNGIFGDVASAMAKISKKNALSSNCLAKRVGNVGS